MAKTTLRNVRVEDPLWSEARAVAAARDENLSEEIRKFLRRYVSRNKALMPQSPDAQ